MLITPSEIALPIYSIFIFLLGPMLLRSSIISKEETFWEILMHLYAGSVQQLPFKEVIPGSSVNKQDMWESHPLKPPINAFQRFVKIHYVVEGLGSQSHQPTNQGNDNTSIIKLDVVPADKVYTFLITYHCEKGTNP